MYSKRIHQSVRQCWPLKEKLHACKLQKSLKFTSGSLRKTWALPQ